VKHDDYETHTHTHTYFLDSLCTTQ